MDDREMSDWEINRLLGNTCEWKAYGLLRDIDGNIFAFVSFGLISVLIGILIMADYFFKKAPTIINNFGPLPGMFLVIGGIALFTWAVRYRKKSIQILDINSEFMSVIDELLKNDRPTLIRVMKKT